MAVDDEEFLIQFRISTCQMLNLGPWERAPVCFSDETCASSKRCLNEALKVLGMSRFLTDDPPQKPVEPKVLRRTSSAA